MPRRKTNAREAAPVRGLRLVCRTPADTKKAALAVLTRKSKEQGPIMLDAIEDAKNAGATDTEIWHALREADAEKIEYRKKLNHGKEKAHD